MCPVRQQMYGGVEGVQGFLERGGVADCVKIAVELRLQPFQAFFLLGDLEKQLALRVEIACERLRRGQDALQVVLPRLHGLAEGVEVQFLHAGLGQLPGR